MAVVVSSAFRNSLIKGGVSVCLRLSTFAHVCLRFRLCICLRLSAFVCVCLWLLAFACAPLCCPPPSAWHWCKSQRFGWETDFYPWYWEELRSLYEGAEPQPSTVLDKDRAPMGPEILSSTGAGVWRKAPQELRDSSNSSVLDESQSASDIAKKIGSKSSCGKEGRNRNWTRNDSNRCDFRSL